jgi:hypothetical protein
VGRTHIVPRHWIGILGAGLLLAAPAVCSGGERAAPDDAHYAFFGLTNDAGAPARAYVSVPPSRPANAIVEAWMIYVFETPLVTGKGRGAYTVTSQTYDCARMALRTNSGDLYDADSRSLDHFAVSLPFEALPSSRSVGRTAAELVCGDVKASSPLVSGVAAVVQDARSR